MYLYNDFIKIVYSVQAISLINKVYHLDNKNNKINLSMQHNNIIKKVLYWNTFNR